MENIKVSSEKPTGEATVTTGMQRDRDSIDDFEHVDRETSPIEKTSKVVSEFDIDRPTQDIEVQYMPKHNIESKEVGLPESFVAEGLGLPGDSDGWNAGQGLPTKGLMDSSNLESFLRNEKGFMSSELNVDPGVGPDDFSGDMPKPPSGNLLDIATLSEPLVRGQDLANADFISSEATKHPVSEQQDPVGSYGDISMKTESVLDLPKAEDKLLDSFNTPVLDRDYLRETPPPVKSTGQDTLHYEDFDRNKVVADAVKQGQSPVVDTPKTSFDHDMGRFGETLEPTSLPLKQHTISDSTVSEVKPSEPKKNPVLKEIDAVLDEITEPKKTPAKSAEPKKSPIPKEVGAGVDEITEPMELFCKMGLDAWFKPERLHPTVVELVYWRDPKKSGVVFGSVLGILLSLSYFSLISVIAYLSLALLTGTIVYRIYKNVIQAVQKTSDGHPFKEILELDLTLPQDKVREMTDMTVTHLNAAALELRRLFLVEDLVDSIKFGVLLWCLTYLGSWFNGMTIIIIMFVAMFTLPKVYENNKAQIDQNLEIVRAKFSEVSAKVKAAVPIGKKPVVEEKKEQ